MSKNWRVLIIIPAFREEQSLPRTVQDVKSHFPLADIVVVNDCSPDATAAVAKSLGIPVLNLPINLGIGGAVQAGILYAVKNGYDIAVQFDGDGQHRAEFLPALVEPVMQGQFDLTIGSRYLMPKSSFKTTAPRRLGMILFSTLFRALTGFAIYDTTSGLRAMSRPLLEFFAEEYPADFPDMPALLAASRRGFRMKEIPVEMNQRFFGKSSTNLWKSIWYPFKTSAAALAVFLTTQR